MAENLFAFKNKLNEFGDVLKNYLWSVSFDKPNAITAIAPLNPTAQVNAPLEWDNLTYLCREISLPSVTMESVIESNFMNWKRKFPAKFGYTGELAVTFEEFESLRALSLLNAWKEVIQSTETGHSSGRAGLEKEDLATTAYITLYHYNGTKVGKKIKINGVFIKDIQEIALSYESAEGIKVQSSFSFDYWEWVSN